MNLLARRSWPSNPLPSSTSMRTYLIAALAVISMLGSACAPRRIPGTDIDDTEESRAILGVMETYRQALEAKNPDAVMALIDPNFQDNSGTTTPADDLNFKNLRGVLADRFGKVSDLRVTFEVKRIEFKQENARAVFTYNSAFKLPGMTQKALGDSELEEMTFKRADEGKWRITSGI
jgi:hypothetical protein